MRDDGKGQNFLFPSQCPRMLSFPFSPAPARFISPLPIPQPTRKTKESAAEERDPVIWVSFGYNTCISRFLEKWIFVRRKIVGDSANMICYRVCKAT